jgi:hypothetical protein
MELSARAGLPIHPNAGLRLRRRHDASRYRSSTDQKQCCDTENRACQDAPDTEESLLFVAMHRHDSSP